jgi:hypothetical protein
MLQLCWIGHLAVNKYCPVDALHSSPQRYPAVDSHLHCPVSLLWQEPLLPFNSSLMFPITNPATFVPDSNEILTPGTDTDRLNWPAVKNFERKLIIHSCVWTCTTDDSQLLYTNRDVTFIKITSDVNNEVLKMFLRQHLISRTQLTADIVSRCWLLCSLEWL